MTNPLEDDSDWTVTGPVWEFSEDFYRTMHERHQQLKEMLEKQLEAKPDNWLDELHDHVGEELD